MGFCSRKTWANWFVSSLRCWKGAQEWWESRFGLLVLSLSNIIMNAFGHSMQFALLLINALIARKVSIYRRKLTMILENTFVPHAGLKTFFALVFDGRKHICSLVKWLLYAYLNTQASVVVPPSKILWKRNVQKCTRISIIVANLLFFCESLLTPGSIDIQHYY